MLKSKIVFIDSIVNLEFVNKFTNKNQKVKGIFSIYNNNVIASRNYQPNKLTHATICAKKFLDNFYGACEIYFIEVLDDSGYTTNINLLLVALQWCLENAINVINLSIGTTSIMDMPVLYEMIDRLVAKGVVIVSACSNSNKMTFPAFFPNVIGVRAIYDKLRKNGFEYYEDIDGIEISCYLGEEIVKYKKKYYPISCANSFAAPIVSANVCKLINKGYCDLTLINMLIRKEALTINVNNQVNKSYFEKQISIPILQIIKGDGVCTLFLIQELLARFEECGYCGICLSEYYKTDFVKKIISISSFCTYGMEKILHFYSNYCNVDYIILHIHNNINNFNMRDVDVIINTIDNKVCYYDDRTKNMDVKGYENLEELFLEVYNLLLEE